MTPRPPTERRQWLRPALAPAGVIVLAALVATACSGSRTTGGPVLHWNYFFDSVFHPDGQIRNGLLLTVVIAVTSQIIGVVLGTLAALGKMARFVPFRILANLYIWFFRGTPLVVQIVFFFFGLSVARIYGWPPIVLGPLRVEGEVQAGIFALGVNEGAYFAEIVRAGILSIDPGQMEAAKSLGMRYALAMRRIVLPQAARVIVPPLGNEFNNMLKTTSLLVLISVPELYTVFNRKQGNAFAPFEFYLAAAVWFLLLTTIWSVIQAYIERRLGKGVAGASSTGPGFVQRLFGSFRSPAEEAGPMITGGR